MKIGTLILVVSSLASPVEILYLAWLVKILSNSGRVRVNFMVGR